MRFKYLLAAGAGAATTLAFAPFDLKLIAFITPAILFLLLQNQSIKQATLTGYLFGAGFFGTGISWVYVSINTYGGTHWLLASIITAFFCLGMALFFALQSWLYQKYLKPNWLSFAALWLSFEWLRSWLLTGFPWLYLGYVTTDTPLLPLASLGGIWLLSLAVLLPGLALANLWLKRSSGNYKAAYLALLACITLPITVGQGVQEPQTQSSPQAIDIAIVQPNIPQEIKWQPAYLAQILERYVSMTEPLLGSDMILWPETAIPSFYYRVAPFLEPLVQRQRTLGGNLVTGLPVQVEDTLRPGESRIHNSLRNLTQQSTYHKQRLVPFGEYVPFEDELRGLINFLDIPSLSFSLPQAQQPLLQIGKYHFSAAICYEIAYPELVRRNSQSADVLLTVSNDTWFSHSIGPDQHFQMARIRAVENGRWLVRAANNGISAVVDPRGNVTAQAPRYTQAVLKTKVWKMSGTTVYQRAGLWPVLITCLLVIGLSLCQRKKSSTANART
ncbi:MAG: apolipoprotein N-acyltransferase [Pseudomonadales bacterium]